MGKHSERPWADTLEPDFMILLLCNRANDGILLTSSDRVLQNGVRTATDIR